MSLQILTGFTRSNTLSVVLDGRLDASTSPELETVVGNVLQDDVHVMVMDLAKLVFISSAGLRTFAKLRKTMIARNGHLFFVNLSPQVAKVFEIVKAVPITSVFRGAVELDDYLASMQQKAAVTAKAGGAPKPANAAEAAQYADEAIEAADAILGME